MKKMMLSALFAFGVIVGIEAAPTDTVTQADLQAILQRISKLEAENKAQAAKIADLESKNKALVDKQSSSDKALAATDAKLASAQKALAATDAKLAKTDAALAKTDATLAKTAQQTAKVQVDAGTEISESGKIYTTSNGKKYYLADASAKIFEPLSESGLQITPYGYLVLEGVYADHGLDMDWSTDFVQPKYSSQYRDHNSTLSMQDSILGVQFMTPEAINGWKFSGKAEFDMAGANADDYAFHWRHLYVNAEHESGWSILFGQTWHLWKMVTPSEIDGAWMENAGHPYRRSPQVRVTKKWDWDDSSLEWRLGFVKNGPNASSDRDGDGQLDSSASAWGWFETAAVYDHKAVWETSDRRWLVGVGGMYGRDASHRLTPLGWGGDEDNYNSQMIMLAAAVPFLEKFKLTGQVYGGENLGRVQAGCGQGVAFTPGLYGEKGEEVTTVGGFIDLGYQLNDDWSFAIGYGFDDPRVSDGKGVAYNDGSGVNTDYYEFNDRLYIDAFYQITSNFRLGLEYARLSTDYAQSGDAIANRVQFSAFYDF